MAKLPKTVTPLRQVRLATKLSQREFANLVGIKYDLYESLELGRATLKREHAEKIQRATGALPDSLDPKRSDCAIFFSKAPGPYSEKSWLRWKRAGKASIERNISDFAQDLIGWTQLVCLLAIQNGKFWDLHNLLAKALTDCAAQCGLNMQKALAHELRYARQRLSFTYGELRGNPALAQAVGFKDKSHVRGRITAKDDAWRTSVPLADLISWDPSSAMPMPLLRKLARTFPWHKAGPSFIKGHP